MEYKGKLYGKVGRHYFPLVETTEDIDKLRSELSALKQQAEREPKTFVPNPPIGSTTDFVVKTGEAKKQIESHYSDFETYKRLGGILEVEREKITNAEKEEINKGYKSLDSMFEGLDEQVTDVTDEDRFCKCGNPSKEGFVHFEGDENLIYTCVDCNKPKKN